ncbi:MAG: hypothetical protein HUU20_22805 [Pirellulales bacterium]|nr:hypothetical protein [Pirellulales bacterium]
MDEVILVTDLGYRKGEAVFRAVESHKILCVAADEAPLTEAVLQHNCRAVIVGINPYRGPIYEALGRIGGGRGAVMARFGVGHDNIDKGLARQHGILVTNTPGALDASVAEHAFWLIGELARNLGPAQASLRAGDFSAAPGTELAGKTLGILGCGEIGRRAAAIARFGFGMRVLAADIRPFEDVCQFGETKEAALGRLGLARYTDDVESVFREADFVTLHLSANEKTRHFINAQRLGWMKPGAMLVNTARGSVIDEDALYDALAAGHLGGAALDVFQNEPYVPVTPDKDLRTLANVVLTPHIGSNTWEANRRMAQTALKNVMLFLAGHIEEMNQVAAG